MRVFECSKCGFRLISRYEYYSLDDDQGTWMTCPRPGERDVYRRVMGWRGWLSASNSDCLCLDCLQQFEADLGEWVSHGHIDVYRPGLEEGKDKKECPECKSRNVKTNLELIGQVCPWCKEGIIEQILTSPHVMY